MSKVTKLAAGFTAICALFLLSSVSAMASPTQYTIGPSSQTIGIVGSTTKGTVDVTFGSCAVVSGNTVCTLSGTADLTGSSSATTYTLEELYSGTGSSPVTATETGTPGIFAIALNGATTQVKFDDQPFQAVDYSIISDGSPNPKFSGTWNAGGVMLPFDYTIANIQTGGACSLGSTCTLDVVSQTPGATINSSISSGEFVTPEPASLSLFGIGLLGLAFIFRRQLRATV